VVRLVSRNSLVIVAVLTLYAVVNVGADALHHHQFAIVCPESAQAGARNEAADPADDDDDDDEHCVLCKVLHLAKTAPAVLTAETTADRTGETFCPAGFSCPCSLPSVRHARAPPAA
jgi:hypothetical protein